jgi:ATP phosphoribosyltransferase regulatory subunit
LARGRTLARGEKSLLNALDRLTQVYQSLCAAGYEENLFLDLGEFRGFDYYDGIVFDVFATGIGVELGGGGRYDHLIGRFGRDLASTGFALNVDRLFRALGFSREGADHARRDLLLVASEECADEMALLASRLRRLNRRVVQEVVAASGKRLIAAALHAGRERRLESVIVLDSVARKNEELLVITLDDTQGDSGLLEKITMPIQGFIDMMAASPNGTEGNR